MPAPKTSPKEEFFRTQLVPAGQVVELYLHYAPDYLRKALSQLLFETLGLVSVFAISPATPDRKPTFQALGRAVASLTGFLKGELALLEQKGPRHNAKFKANAASVESELKPLVAALLQAIKYTSAKRTSWLERLMRDPTPLTANGRYNKWRTFVKNLDFQENMQALGLGAAAKGVPALGSAQGRQEVPLLWRACFAGEAADGLAAPPDQALLPPGVRITVSATGMLNVAYAFEPRKALAKYLKTVTTTLPPETEALLVPLEFARTCNYRQLAGVIDELLAWQALQLSQAGQTEKAIGAWSESCRMAALQAKLDQTFTEEERALLHKANLLGTSPKPAAKRTVRARKAA